MYIISKYKDYYDGVAGTTGIDKTIVYERSPIEIDEQLQMPKEFHGNLGWNRTYENHFFNVAHVRIDPHKTKKYTESKFFIIGFCGKLYLGWRFLYNVNVFEMGAFVNKPQVDIIYGYNNVKEYLKDNFWRMNPDDDVNYIINYNAINMFREINAPVFVYDTDAVIRYGDHGKQLNNGLFTINPILKDYEFYKVIDSFQAFQEIQMFLGGVLGRGEKEITVVADKYKIAQHGFDKFSFRKDKEVKK